MLSKDGVRVALRTRLIFDSVDADATRGLFVRLATALERRTVGGRAVLESDWVGAACDAFNLAQADAAAQPSIRAIYRIVQMDERGGVATVSFEALAVALVFLAVETPVPVHTVEAAASVLWDALTEGGARGLARGRGSSGGSAQRGLVLSLDAFAFVAWQIIKLEATLAEDVTAPCELWVRAIAFVEHFVSTCGVLDFEMFCRWWSLGCGVLVPSISLLSASWRPPGALLTTTAPPRETRHAPRSAAAAAQYRPPPPPQTRDSHRSADPEARRRRWGALSAQGM